MQQSIENLPPGDGVPAGQSGAGRTRRGRGHRRLKSIAAWVLVVLACLLAVLSVVVLYARDQLLNTDAYVATVAPLASNPDIQAAVAKQASERLIDHTDVQQRIKNALPSRAGFLVTPIASQLENVTEQIVLKAVESSAFQTVWVTANRVSHAQLVSLLTGANNGTFSSKSGKITIDLSQLETQAKQKLDARGITVFNKVPAVKGLNFVLFQSDNLAKIQKYVRWLNKIAVVLPILALLGFAGAIVLTSDRRRGLVRAATGLALSMGLILIVVAVARNQYLSGLPPARSRAANAAVIDTVSSQLRGTVRIVLIVAALVAVGAVVAGNTRLRAWLAARGSPGWMTGGPVHTFVAAHRKGLQWTVLGLGLAVLVIWNQPTALVAVVVVLIALVVVALIGLLGGGRPAPVGSGGAGPTGAPPLGPGAPGGAPSD